MCGIVCYSGNKSALLVLVEGLRKLEYRGYDSSGLAVLNNDTIDCRKAAGKIRVLEEELQDLKCNSSIGIAHTRWATHGKPSTENAHPHSDCLSRIFVVHNGIVENYQTLKDELISNGHYFSSETDSEVLAHLIEEYLTGDLTDAVTQALNRVQGTFGIGVISTSHPDTIVVARRGSPLILGIGENELFAASDVSAIVNHTKEVIYLQDDDIATLTPSSYHISNLRSSSILRSIQFVDWDISTAGKKGFPHFMLKEIYEQPEVVRDAMRGRLVEEEGISKLGGLEFVSKQISEMKRLIIVSCGTSFYAGLLARYIIESCTEIAVEVDLASEFRYRRLNFNKGTVVLAISQSGETADTLAAVVEAQRKGALVLGLVNVVGSNIARQTEAGIYNHAGPEVGVASTKSFTSQVTILMLISLLLARHRQMSIEEGQRLIRQLKSIPEKMERILESAPRIEAVAKRYANYQNFLYLGRKFNYPTALEGALKLKEISYRHAEAYAAGEIGHGPISLIHESFPSVCLVPRDSTYDKMLRNIQEVRAKGSPVIAVATEGDTEISKYCNEVIEVPASIELVNPLLNVLPLQLLAYYIARENGCDIDQPRNLAKSVTVE